MRIGSPAIALLSLRSAVHNTVDLFDQRVDPAGILRADGRCGRMQPPPVVGVEILSRPDDHRHAGGTGHVAKPREKLKAVDAGHQEIDDENGRWIERGLAKTLSCVRYAYGRVAELANNRIDETQRVGIVVDDEYGAVAGRFHIQSRKRLDHRLLRNRLRQVVVQPETDRLSVLRRDRDGDDRSVAIRYRGADFPEDVPAVHVGKEQVES